MKIKDKLAAAVSVNNRITEYYFTQNSVDRFGAVYITVILNGQLTKKKIYYNQRPRLTNHNDIKQHVSAIIVSITTSTKVCDINQKIDNELNQLELGLWAEAEAGRVLTELKDQRLIEDFYKSSDVVDVIDGYDFLIIKNNKKELKVDITSSKARKVLGKNTFLKQNNIYVLSVNKSIPSAIQKKLFLKMLETD